MTDRYLYQITKAYGRGTGVAVAQTIEKNDAILLIKAKLAADSALKVQTTYRLLEMGEVLQEFNSGSDSQESSGTEQQGTGQRFSPSPLSNAPRPPGMPHSSFKDFPKADDKDKK